MVGKDRVSELDALRQLHDVARSRVAENRAVPTEGTGAAKRIERTPEGRWTGAIIDDIHALAASQALHLFGELSFGIDDDLFGAGLLRNRHLVLR